MDHKVKNQATKTTTMAVDADKDTWTTLDSSQPKRYKGLLPMNYSLDKVLNHLSVKSHVDAQLLLQIAGHWQEIIGTDYGAYCLPLKVIFPKHHNVDGTLQIRLYNAALATLLSHREPAIIDRINLLFGFHIIAKLKYLTL